MTNRNIKSKNLEISWLIFYPVSAVITFICSLYLFGHYYGGDQEHYKNFYISTLNASIYDISTLQRHYTGSAEPAYGYIIWLASNLNLDKNIFISIVNAFFAVILAFTIKRFNGTIALCVVVFTNYYFIVMITAAERLKFSYIIILISMAIGTRLGKTIFLGSVLFHFQSLINLALAGFNFATKRMASRKLSFVDLVIYVISALVSIPIIYYLYNNYALNIIDKASSYSLKGGVVIQVIPIIVLTSFAFFIGKSKREVLSYFIPLIILVLILGGSRINMIGAVMLFYLSLKYSKYFHPLMIILYIYYAINSVLFIQNIIIYGTGYI